MVIVPVEVFPPTTVDGLRLISSKTGELMVSEPVFVEPLKLPVMTAVVVTETAAVLTVNVADVCPAATGTEAGTVAELTPLDNLTLSPPLGATPEMVIVPVDEDPPDKLLGLRVSAVIIGGFTVSAQVSATVPSFAVRIADFCAETAAVKTVNVALD